MPTNRSLSLLPDPSLKEYGEILASTLEIYARRLQPTDLAQLVDPPIASTLQKTRHFIDADSIAIWLADKERESLIIAYSDPVDPRLLGRALPLSEGLISLVFASEQPICENGVAMHAQHSKRIDSVTGKRTTAMIAVPFYLGGYLCGILSAVRWEDDGSDDARADQQFTSDHLIATQRESVVFERLLNLELAKVIMEFGV